MGGAMSGLAYGSNIYQGQRFFSPTNDAWNPIAVGPVRSSVPAPIPTAAPINSGPALTRYDTGTAVGKGGLMGSGSIPWLVIGALAVGVLWLHHVHFS